MIIYAHNINTGGGLVLLQELVNRLENETINSELYITDICSSQLKTSSYVNFKKGSLFDLIKMNNDSLKLYFGNLPPIFRNRNSAVYVHNLYYTLTFSEILKGVLKNKISKKYLLLNLYFRFFHRNCDYIFVQTPNMKSSMQKICSRPVKLMPFFRSALVDVNIKPDVKTTDICAIGLPSKHKNYKPFLCAILKLVKCGYKINIEVTIPLTVDNQDLIDLIHKINNEIDTIAVINHGFVDFDTIKLIYSRSKALLFPSMKESLGLPLIEAAECNLEVFAPKLPYVDDVIENYTIIDPSDETNIFEILKKWLNHNIQTAIAKPKIYDRGSKLLNGQWNE